MSKCPAASERSWLVERLGSICLAAHGKVERGCEEAIEIYWVTAKVLIFTTDSFLYLFF